MPVYVSMETMDLPVRPPLEPMLAKVPFEAGVWSYEPKWDGFIHWTCPVSSLMRVTSRKFYAAA